MLGRIIALLRKEFLAVLKDPKSRFVVAGPPIIQLIVFGYAATFDLDHVPFAVYNEDRGAASRDLTAAFAGSPSFDQVAAISRRGEIARLIDRRAAMMVLRIGPNFSRDLHSGRGATIQVILDGRNSNTALLALNYARGVVEAYNERWWRSHHGDPPPARLQIRAWFNPNLESQWFIVPGIVGLLTLVVTMLLTALSVAREREQGTFDQLLVTPLRPAEILLGKTLPGFIIGLVEATLIITLAVAWFHIPLLGSLAVLYIGLVLFLLSAVGVGLMISALAITQQQGLLGAFLFLVPAVILSGFATPISNMPVIVQYITYLDPLRYFMTVLRGVFLEAATLELLLPQLWPMGLIAAATLALAGWLFRHRMY